MKKIFLLFGSSGDLGKGAVDYFLSLQYDYYYFFSRNELQIKTGKRNFEVVKISDITDEKNVEIAFNSVKHDTDSLYFLFSTIGGFVGGEPVENTDYNDWQKMINMNLNSAFLISKYFTKLINGTQGGALCFTSAYSSFHPSEGKTAYNVSKSALNYFVESLALETKKNNLSVNAVAPFAIDTPSNREWIEDISQLVTPRQICEVVESLFINYKQASGNIIRLP